VRKNKGRKPVSRKSGRNNAKSSIYTTLTRLKRSLRKVS